MAVLAFDLRILLTEQDVLNLLPSIVKFTSFTLITHQRYHYLDIVEFKNSLLSNSNLLIG
jgi:hypothetical protein